MREFRHSRLGRYWMLVKKIAQSWLDDYVPSMGAALAYYTLFSLAPLLLIVVSVAGLMFGEDAARGEIAAQLRALMGVHGASAVEDLLASVNKPAEGVAAAALGAGLLFIGATTVFGELQDALNRIWHVPAPAKTSGWFTLVRTRLLSFGMIFAIGFLLIVSLVASAALAAVGRWWDPILEGWYLLAATTNVVIGFVLITLMFALIYKVMPSARVAWRDVWVGSVVTAFLFMIGKSLIGLYIGRTGVASGFGAAASFAVLMLWVYYSAQIFLIGAKFTWVYAHTFGSCRDKPGPDGLTPMKVGPAPLSRQTRITR